MPHRPDKPDFHSIYYIDSTVNIDEMYVSKEFLIKNNMDIFPADKLMAVHTDKNSGISIEQAE